MSSAIATSIPPTPAAAKSAPTPDLERSVSEEEYWEEYYEAEPSYEWNNGRLEEKPVSDQQTYLTYLWFLLLLDQYLSVHPIAQPTGLEFGFRLALPHKTVIRKPDLGVVRNDNPVALALRDRSYKGVFDLCVEALSDSNRKNREHDTVTKKAEYLAGGVSEYYILHPDPDRRAFFGLDRRGFYAPIAEQGGVIRSAVLPGFCFRPDDLMRRPSARQMMGDQVYRDFMLPGWQAESRRADAEAKRADTEAQARQEAERQATAAQAEVARLRALLAAKDH